jgi:nuclear pore complex protein Nup133
MWKVQEAIQKRQPKDREYSLMEFALVGIHEAEKTTPQSSKGEKDRVRHWLIHDPGRIEHLMVWLVYTFDVLKEEEIDEPALIADYYREACDLWTAAYTAVLAFREDNAQLYGLGDELLHEGILTTGYAGLPAFWTTSAEPLGMVQSLINESCKFLAQWWNVLDSDKGNAPPRKTLEHIASRLPDLIEVVSRLLTEEDLRNKEEAGNAGPQKGVSKNTQHLRLLIMAMAP